MTPKYLKHSAEVIRMHSQSQGQPQVPWFSMMCAEVTNAPVTQLESFIAWSNIKKFAIEAMKDGEEAGVNFKSWLCKNHTSISRKINESWLERKLDAACQSLDPLALSLTLTAIASVADAEIKQSQIPPVTVGLMH